MNSFFDSPDSRYTWFHPNNLVTMVIIYNIVSDSDSNSFLFFDI